MLTTKDVHHIARLARIDISDADAERYRAELSAVLGYFEKLNEVNTDGVEPIGHITGMKDIVRDDAVKECAEEERARILANVPDAADGFIRVPKVL